METWTEHVRKEIRSIKDKLEMTFNDKNNRYVFHFSDINAYSYGSGCPDFDLFVDIYVTGKGGAKPTYYWNQTLGNSLDPKPRESIPFGKEYYDAVYPKLIEITEQELRANNNRLIEGLEKLTDICGGLKQLLF